MAGFDRFLIAPFNSGLQTNLKSWLLPEDAFSQLDNAYVWRGRVRKRFGSRFMGSGWSSAQTEPLFSRLRINLGPTVAGVLAGTVPGTIFKQGQAFSVGDNIFTVNSATPGVQPMLSTGNLVATTDSSGNASGTFAGGVAGQSFNINGTIFTISGVGLNPFTVTGLGIGTGTYNTGTGAYTFVGASPNASIYFIGATGTYNITTGAFSIAGVLVDAPVWFYPSTPVMGFSNYSPLESINNQPSYAFDQQFAYIFSGGFWQRSGTALWQGNDLNFFWSTNWLRLAGINPLMFTTNFHVTNYDGAGDILDDPIWWLNSSTWTAAKGTNGFYFLPAGGAPYSGPYVKTARLIVQFKNRLVLLNTVENSGSTNVGTTDPATGNLNVVVPGVVVGQYFIVGTTTFTVVSIAPGPQALTVSAGGTGTATYNSSTSTLIITGGSLNKPVLFFGPGTNATYGGRARFSHFGSPLSINAWYEGDQVDSSGNIGDGGGYVDAATDEEIISCEFVKDRLVVYFERSTWALVYNNNQVKPFTWQKINTELGSESQFSTVPFDIEAITIGNTGVHSCNGANVQRIDDKIPQKIFEISNKNIGVQRVAGIRDYFVEMVYWCFPSSNENSADIYPNKVLVYNYKNGSWSFNDDCITAFGYFEQQQGMTWSSTTKKWMEANFSWNSGTIAIQSRQVIAGNQQGFVFIIDADLGRNERAMQITNLTIPSLYLVQLTIINHNLTDTDYISIENAGGITISPTGLNYHVTAIIDANTIQIYDPDSSISGTYTGGGNAARVSNIQITSKQWNPYVDKDRNVFLQRIDFSVLRTAAGEITVDYAPSSSSMSMLLDSSDVGNDSIMGTSILETRPYPINLAPLEQTQEHLWHPLYFQSDGTCIQIMMYFSDQQIRSQSIAWDDFELQGICLYTQPTTSRLN